MNLRLLFLGVFVVFPCHEKCCYYQLTNPPHNLAEKIENTSKSFSYLGGEAEISPIGQDLNLTYRNASHIIQGEKIKQCY